MANNAILKSLACIFALLMVIQMSVSNIFAQEVIPEDYIDEAVVEEDMKIEPEQTGTIILENQVSGDGIKDMYEYQITTDQKMDPEFDWEYVVDDSINCIRFTEDEDGFYSANVTLTGNQSLVFYLLPTGYYKVEAVADTVLSEYEQNTDYYVDGIKTAGTFVEFYLSNLQSITISTIRTTKKEEVVEEEVQEIEQEREYAYETSVPMNVIESEEVKEEIQTEIKNILVSGIGKQVVNICEAIIE